MPYQPSEEDINEGYNRTFMVLCHDQLKFEGNFPEGFPSKTFEESMKILKSKQGYLKIDEDFRASFDRGSWSWKELSDALPDGTLKDFCPYASKKGL